MTRPRNGSPRILPFEEAVGLAGAGGKAAGLGRLLNAGLPVPPGFVIVGATPGHLPAELEAAYGALGAGAVAVRSSAGDEDGADRSFAGQYDTVLNVSGDAELREAVEVCLAGAASARVAAYREGVATNPGGPGPIPMGVVVQRMVDARAAGVAFTADPVTGRRDRVVVDAVAGFGEALVSGQVTPDHWVLTDDGQVRLRELENNPPVAAEAEVRRIAEEARAAAARLAQPLDLEWAIDAGGRLHWLQARPITTLEGDPNEFDSRPRDGDVYTSANFGEMMPGAVCPLTQTVTGWAIDQGIQQMLVDAGVQPGRRADFVTLAVFYGHLFFNLKPMLEFGRLVGGASPEAAMIAICGRVLPDLEMGTKADPISRGWRSFGYLGYVLSGPLEVRRFERRVAAFRIPVEPDPADQYRAIDEGLGFLVDTYHLHLRCSAGSGMTSSILHAVLAKGGTPTAAHEAEVARLLARVEGVESAKLLAGVEAVARAIRAQPGWESVFADAEVPAALSWLRSDAAGAARGAFRAFLVRHGHRSVRELDLRQPGWRDAPEPLVALLQVTLTGGDSLPSAAPEGVGGNRGAAFRGLVRLSRDAVRRREHTKGLLVRVTDEFKRAYRHLATRVVEAGLLAEADRLYFLTHAELGRLVAGQGADLHERAARRREAYGQQERLTFPDLFQGEPTPLEWAPGSATDSDALQGKPVSRGRVVGPARVCRTAAEATDVQPGEILVAPITDVGWTPCFGVIAGLATDVGSAISHGAVVAREYGLPAVVGLREATRVFQNGDRVELDGDRGTLRRVEPAG